jgi:hypothetical protein
MRRTMELGAFDCDAAFVARSLPRRRGVLQRWRLAFDWGIGGRRWKN